MPGGNGKVNCYKCKHFYITWDTHFPRGCRLLGFKSRSIPSEDVLRASGISCLSFEPKNGTCLKRS